MGPTSYRFWDAILLYGQIAHLLRQPHAAGTVGWALRGLSEGTDVPWHRVINAAGRVSIFQPQIAAEQRRRIGRHITCL